MKNIKTHDLKIDTEYFQLQIENRKNWEIRYNDRDYKKGDVLLLHEYKHAIATGRVISVYVDYVFTSPDFLQDGYCILSTSHLLNV